MIVTRYMWGWWGGKIVSLLNVYVHPSRIHATSNTAVQGRLHW
jgi:hypothetical protein